MGTGVLLLAAAAAAHPWWLGLLGSFLVRADKPFPADVAVVLAGDYKGGRVLKGAEMVRDAFAPLAIVSGPELIYGYHESDLAISFAVKQGFVEQQFFPFRHQASSTADEARSMLVELQRRSVRSALIVTSNFHTRRAGLIWRRTAPDLRIGVVSAPHPDFAPDAWWKSRQGRKCFLIEWQKLLADWLGI